MCEIFERWLILKHPNAYTLIEEDYAFFNLPALLKLTLKNWKTFFAKILVIRSPKEDDNAQSLLELIQQEELTDSKHLFL